MLEVALTVRGLTQLRRHSSPVFWAGEVGGSGASGRQALAGVPESLARPWRYGQRDAG